jgi:hypothetical protein
MQALCARCNLTKGGKFVQFDSDFITALRPFQQRFLLACTTMLSHGKRKIMALVTTGGGSSMSTACGR